MKNKTDQRQKLSHDGLDDLCVVPVAPGGFVVVVDSSVMIEPGQCFRIPKEIFARGRAAYRLSWTEEITEEEFMVALEEEKRPWYVYDGRRVRIERVTEKRVNFTDEDGKAGWADKAAWEASAVPVEDEEELEGLQAAVAFLALTGERFSLTTDTVRASGCAMCEDVDVPEIQEAELADQISEIFERSGEGCFRIGEFDVTIAMAGGFLGMPSPQPSPVATGEGAASG
jgi:hypothetical protein